MSTQRTQLQDASQNEGGALNVPLADMTLMPPNLKVWAERDYTQEYGLEQNSQQKNTIVGAEGAGLSSDDRITIYTEWYDEDGRALPEDLGKDNGEQYGLTGRLAKIVAQDQLQEVAHGDLANFPIAPGRQTQVLRLKDNLTTPEHFYIHVSGTQKDENPDFGTSPEREGILATRPKNVTPFLTPLYDENKNWKSFSAWSQMKRAYDAEVIEEEPIKPLPSYAWQYRPEYQFSQISLEVESILREYTDESGTKHEQELITEQQGEGKIPTIRSDDDLVSIFYSLVMPQIPRLTAIDGEQELVFSLGAQEVKAVVSENGQVKFDQLAQIDWLDPSDFLTIRLYLNHDAGNTLWEWAFTRNGLHVYFQVPGNGEFREGSDQQDIEILSLLDDEKKVTDLPKAVPEPIVRTLGGTRLRYRYIPPSLAGIRVNKIQWKINYDGIYCPTYGISTEGCQERLANQPYELASFSGLLPAQLSMYWQPIKKEGNTYQAVWENWAGTLTDDAGVDAHLEVDYALPVNSTSVLPNQPTQANASKIYKNKFKIKTRELKPETDKDKVMVGSDVQILEAMLWQLGISPQKGIGQEYKARAGYSGKRIATSSNGVFLKTCDGSDEKSRNVYSGGWKNCAYSKVALQGMVTRFNSRSFETDQGKIKSATDSKEGKFDQESLVQLGKVWKEYMESVLAYPNTPNFKLEQLNIDATDPKSDLMLVEKAMDGTITARQETFTLDYPPYTLANHNLALADYQNNTVTRFDLFKAWVAKETQGRHWGVVTTPYRIVEGGADEVGSVGFSQIWFSYRYGKLNTCKKKTKLNLYYPLDNLMGFLLHAGDNAVGCQGGLYYAFHTEKYMTEPEQDTKDKLVGYYCDQNGVNKICAYAPSAYDRLVKGLMGYNMYSGNKYLLNCSLPEMIAGTRKFNGNSCVRKITKGTVLDYAMTILHNGLTQKEYSANFLSLPHRTYVWKGGVEPDEIPVIGTDGKIEKNADGIDKMQTNPNAGKDWCFAYGEKEWRKGKVWSEVKQGTEYFSKLGKPQIPIGKILCN